MTTTRRRWTDVVPGGRPDRPFEWRASGGQLIAAFATYDELNAAFRRFDAALSRMGIRTADATVMATRIERALTEALEQR